MNRVVYITGAGFSAPLGVPVMSNFLLKSKDMYFSEPQTYQYFKKVFDRIKEMSVAKNYYSADLFNIEEILSISEMNSFVRGHAFRDEFLQYIRDVIQFYTPPLEPMSNYPANLSRFAFGKDPQWRPYGYFVANLCNIRLRRSTTTPSTLVCEAHHGLHTQYSVVSLNYDLVLESICAYLHRNYRTDCAPKFATDNRTETPHQPVLAKLHGSVDGVTIVPPTWSKGTHPEIVPIWAAALKTIEQANYIRFIGYSLPSADAYVRYLLKSASITSPHLKGIDVICLDPDGSVRSRFESFIAYSNFRFAARATQDYLGALVFRPDPGSAGEVTWNRLESVHETFMVQNTAV